jgi:hypothetical protein
VELNSKYNSPSSCALLTLIAIIEQYELGRPIQQPKKSTVLPAELLCLVDSSRIAAVTKCGCVYHFKAALGRT